MSSAGTLIDDSIVAEIGADEAPQLASARRSDMLRVGLCVVDQAVASAAPFVTSLIVGRSCSREELGIYYLALTLVLLARGVQEQLVAAPYVIFASRREGAAAAAYAGSSWVHQIAIAGVACLALAVFLGVHQLGIGPPGLEASCLVLLLVLPSLLAKEFFRQFAFAHLNVGAALTLDFVVTAAQILGLVLLAWQQALSAPLAYVVMGAACGLGLALAWPRRRQAVEIRRSMIWRDWLENWSFGRWALAGHLLGSAAAYLMPWFLASMHGESMTGLLAACVTLVGVANTFVTGISNYLSPQAARAFAAGGPQELQKVLGRTAAVFSVTLAAFCLLMFLFGDELLRLAYGSRFGDSAGILPLLALNLWINSLGVVAGNGLWAMNCPRANFAADGCSLLTATVLAAIAVPSGAAFGAALAVLGGTVIGTLVRMIALYRRMQEQHCPEAMGAEA